MTSRRQRRIRHIAAMTASATALVLSAWLASIPGQAEDRKPVTCTDAAGIIYDRGTPGFERCLQDMNQAAQVESEQAAQSSRARRSGRASRPTNTPTTAPTVAPEPLSTE